jgi:hypothetical protein
MSQIVAEPESVRIHGMRIEVAGPAARPVNAVAVA